MRRLLPLICFLAVLTRGIAEERVLSLDYEKAVQLALSKNFDIQVESFAPRIARARQMAASGRFDPNLLSSYTYSWRRNEQRIFNAELQEPPVVPGQPVPDLFVRQDGHEFDNSITGLTPWGMSYDFGLSTSVDSDSRRIIDRYDTFAGLQVIQPLLRGFGTDVNLAQIRIARADRAMSEWQLRASAIDIVTRTLFVYNDLYFSINNLAVERRSRDLAAQLLRDNKKREEIGVMNALDVVQAQADVAAREERVLVAERAVLDNENFLKQLVTDERADFLNTKVQIAPPPMLRQPYPENVAADIARALELRPDYRQALLDLQKRQITVVFRRNAAWPQLDLVASFGLNGVDTTYAGSFGNLTEGDNLAWSAGATFSLPVPNREARGNLDAAKLEVAQALVALKRLEQSIIVGVDNAAGQIRTTLKRIDAARAARELAAQTLAAGEARLATGTTTTFEVLQFQRDLAAAEIAEIQAITDHNKAIAEYARQTGTTLERAGIYLDQGKR